MRLEIKYGRPPDLIHVIWGPIALLLIAAAGFLREIGPRLPGCFFHEMTGIPCPTCGATRSLMALSRFDLAGSLAFNPLVPLFTAGLIIFSMFFLIGGISNRSLRLALTSKGKRAIRYSAIALFACNWLFLILVHR